eukprot:Sspe_Gene.5949::Locus_1988_Transcript_1_1_Confidence_1.000_Length_670::g.5949::m.5949
MARAGLSAREAVAAAKARGAVGVGAGELLVYVESDVDRTPVEVDLDATVEDVKNSVAEVEGWPRRSHQVLYFGGEGPLDDKSTLADVGVVPDSTLTLKTRPPFEVGHRLEAVDRKYPKLRCVASVKDVAEDRNEILVTFDGWGSEYDYWTNIDHPDIAPIGTAAAQQYKLEAPLNTPFASWGEYLERNNFTAAPREAFNPRHTDPSHFFV